MKQMRPVVLSVIATLAVVASLPIPTANIHAAQDGARVERGCAGGRGE